MTRPPGISDLLFDLHLRNGTVVRVMPLWGERYHEFFARVMDYEGVDFMVVRRKPDHLSYDEARGRPNETHT